jgi:hypothetical protein
MNMKTLLAALVLGTAAAGFGTAAMAADGCMAKVTEAKAQAEALTDATQKEKAMSLLKTAEEEATQEMDEDECMEALENAEKVIAGS